MKKDKSKSIKTSIGDLVQISLDKEWHIYARILKEPLFAFYDSRTRKDLAFDEIQKRPILFKIWVMKSAVSSGRWSIIANYPLEENLKTVPQFFKQDALDSESFSIYFEDSDVHEYPAKRDECIGLERAAVWSPEHVEERLRDHYAGKKNKWVESLKPK